VLSHKLNEVHDDILTRVRHHQITHRGWKMVTIGIIGISLGAILAQYFRAFALVPFCAAALVSTIAIESMWEHFSAHSIVGGALAAVGIQLGYFLGLVARQLIAALRHPGLTKSGHKHAFPSESRR
jgi:hypothetical protein